MDETGRPVTLPTGESQIAQFRILGRLGQGGMGVVYRAEDEILRRPVAIKVLPESGASSEVRQRFIREARSAAAITHPNVAVVYQVGESDGRAYIAMELIEGRTLRARLQEGRLTEEQALDLATQVAGGLAAAHAKGIVHRDLKPENVMITPSGQVKLLDFGLAKLAIESEVDTPPGGGLEPTRTRVTSDHAAIMGTPEYMSPEQAVGEPLDIRSDVFSFGIMLYEMLAGTRPFAGATPVALLMAIARDPPLPLRSRVPEVDPHLEAVVARCLEKAPALRFASASEIVLALSAAKSELRTSPKSTIPGSVAAAPARSSSAALVALAVGAAAVGLAAWWIATHGQAPASPPLSTPSAKSEPPRSSADRAAGEPARPLRYVERRPWLTSDEVHGVRLSPDAQRVAYLVFEAGHWDVYVQALAGVAPRARVPPPPGAPGRQWGEISGFFPNGDLLLRLMPPEAGELWRVPTGGEPQVLRTLRCEAGEVTLSPDGTRILATCGDALRLESLSDDTTTRLTDGSVAKAVWSPAGDAVAYATVDASQGYVVSVDLVSADGARRDRKLTGQDARNSLGEVSLAWPEADRLVLWVKRGARGGALVDVALKSPSPEGAPRDLFAWPDSQVLDLAISHGVVAIAKMSPHREVLTASLSTNLQRFDRPLSALASDEASDKVLGWYDDRRVAFTSARDGLLGLYASGDSNRPAELLSRDLISGATLGEETLIGWSSASDGGACALLRLVRGTEQALFTSTSSSSGAAVVPCGADLRCASTGTAARCFTTERDVAGASTWTSVDLGTGHSGPRLYSTKQRVTGWDVSPDGTTLAYATNEPLLSLVALRGGLLKQVRLPPEIAAGVYVRFLPDGRHLIVAGGDHPEDGPAGGLDLLAISDLEGHAKVLTTNSGDGWFGMPFVSPHGNEVAVPRYSTNSRLWLLEGQ